MTLTDKFEVVKRDVAANKADASLVKDAIYIVRALAIVAVLTFLTIS